MLRLVSLAAFALTGFMFSEAHALEVDEWLGLKEQRYSLALHYGYDSENDDQWGLGLKLPGFNYSEFYFDYANVKAGTDQNTQTLNDYALSWSSDPFAEWAINVGYRYKGKPDAVEVRQYNFGLFHIRHEWIAGIKFYDGDVRGYTREFVADRFNIPDSASIDRSGFGFELGRLGRQWALNLTLDAYDYSRDLSNALNSRLFLLTFNDAVISQTLLLTNWNIAALYNYRYERVSINLGTEYFENVVDSARETLVSAGFRYAVSGNVDLVTDYFVLVEEGTRQLNISVAINW